MVLGIFDKSKAVILYFEMFSCNLSLFGSLLKLEITILFLNKFNGFSESDETQIIQSENSNNFSLDTISLWL